MRVRTIVLSLLLCSSVPLAMRADTLASFAPAGAANTAPNYLGEKLLTGGSGTYNKIVFDFLTTTSTAYAIGNGYLLTQQYLGTPAGLSSATPGYLGSAAASGGFYSFASAMTLASGTSYFFYEDALAPVLTIGGGLTAGSNLEFFYAPSGGSFTGQPGASVAFTLTGSPVGPTGVTPEPSSFVLLGSGLLTALGAMRQRTHRRA